MDHTRALGKRPSKEARGRKKETSGPSDKGHKSDTKKSSQEGSTKSDVLKFLPVSEQGAETIFHKETASFFQPKVS